MADEIYVEFRQIARIESGEVNTSLHKAAAIVKVFGMTLAELFDFEWEL